MPRSLTTPAAIAPLLVAALFGIVSALAPPTAKATDPAEACTLLTEQEVEAVTGLEAQPGVAKETATIGQRGCGWGTEPYEVQVAVNPSLDGPAVVGLGDSGHPVDGVGDGAEWWWCEECLETDSSSSANFLVVAHGTWYVHIGFEPTTDAAADDSELVQATHRAWAVELARLILPRLDEATNPSPVPVADWSDRGSSTYEGSWTLTAYATESDSFEPEYVVGDSRPGTIEFTCSGEGEDACDFVATIDGGQFWQVATLQRDGAGDLRSVTDVELDNCEDGQIARTAITASFGPERATAVVEDLTIPRTCSYDNSTLYSEDLTWTFDGVLVDHVPAEPVASPLASAAPSASEGAGAGAGAGTSAGEPSDPGSAPRAREEFARSVPTVTEVSTDPMVVLQSAALAALLVFLMPFPSQLFNSTLETHEDEVRRWFRLDRIGSLVGGIGALWASWPGVMLFTALAALLYGFLDPGFGFDLGSLATFVGMLVGIVLVTAAFAIPLVLAHRRHGERPSLKVVPVSLAIGVVCVLLSRLTDFQPGYLYGLLIGLAFARELSAAEEGRATAVAAGLMLAVAFVAWVGLGALPEGDGFGLVVARTALAALMVAGLEGVVFGLLPMRFLPGEPLYRWNRILWAGLLLIGAFAFFHILINPASGYLSDTSRTPLFTVLALLVGFSLVSVAFWAWFRFRPSPGAATPPAGTAAG